MLRKIVQLNLLIVTLMLCLAVFAGVEGYSQVLASTYGAASNKGNNGRQQDNTGKYVSLEQMLLILKKQYNVHFVYEDAVLQNKRVLKKDFRHLNIQKVLSGMLNPLGLDFMELDEQNFSIFVKRPSRAVKMRIEKNVNQSGIQNTMSHLDPHLLVPERQQRIVEGTVVSANDNLLLPGVSVLVKGTKIGAITDINGAFKLSIPQTGQTLVVSFLGFKTQEVPITEAGKYSIKLSADAEALKQVVVTGIFERRKERFTGATATFSGEELKALGNQNIIQSLKSLDPSFAVMENNLAGSNPNRLPDIQVRGKTSISTDKLKDEFSGDPNQPLFILDGFETSLRNVVDLDMNRVKSITVLKDAASTALYGAKAANGVVVIETKKPEPGQIRLSYTGDFRIEAPDLSDYNLMNAEEKLEFERLSGRYTDDESDHDGQLELDALYNDRLAEARRGVNSYWLNEPSRVGYTQSHSLYAEGGSDAFRYGVNGRYRHVAGAMKGSDRDTWSGAVDLIYRKNKVNISNQVTVSGYTGNESPYGSFSLYARTNPYFRKPVNGQQIIKYLDRSPNPGSYDSLKVVNPLYNAQLNNTDRSTNLAIQNNFQLIWDLNDDLRLQGSAQIQKGITTSTLFVPAEHSSFDEAGLYERGKYSNTRRDDFSYRFNTMLSYNKVFNNLHALTVNARAEAEQSSNESLELVALGFPRGVNGNPAYAFSYQPDSKPSMAIRLYRRTNVLASVNYAYDMRYILDATYRLEGSTAFGSNEKYSAYWSVGAGWNIHNEKFMDDVNWIDYLKIRGNAGLTGNQNLGSTTSISVYTYDSQTNIFGQGVGLSTLGNPDLEWQNTLQVSGGLDIAFMKNRLRATFDVFHKKTDPLVVPVSLPSSTGLFAFPLNAGYQISKGFEYSLRFSPFYQPSQQIVWTLGINGRIWKSELGGFDAKLQSLNEEQQNNLALNRYRDGYSQDALWAVPSLGIDPATGKEIFLKKDGQHTFDYDQRDEIVVGNLVPDVEGVISSTFRYKGFNLGIYLRYRVGAEKLNRTLYEKIENISFYELAYNQDKRALYDRWQKPGDIAQFKGIGDQTHTPISSRFVQEENLLAGESINLGYEFDNVAWMQRIGFKTLRLNAYLNDIFRASSILTERGIDYPFANSVSFSINASF